MKLSLSLLFLALTAAAQSPLPLTNIITTTNQVCTVSVIDTIMSVNMECLDKANNIMHEEVAIPHEKAAILGIGEVMCMHWKVVNGTTTAVRLSCVIDDDSTVTTGPKMVLDGTLQPAAKKRRWYLFWR